MARMQIIQQLITESVLLSFAGGVLGLVVAKFGLRAILAVVPGSSPRIENIGVNTSVLLFALGVSILVGILFGLAPGLKHANTDLQADIRAGGRGSTAPVLWPLVSWGLWVMSNSMEPTASMRRCPPSATRSHSLYVLRSMLLL
jgi:hypothetical protein